MVAGILFGLAARSFVWITHLVESVQRRFISYPPLKPFVGGLVLVLLYSWEGSYRFAGLGIETIKLAFGHSMSFLEPLLKGIFTAITVGTGFKGGEFVPLVFVGSTLGSALAAFLPAATAFLAALGFASVFAGASNTPFACAVMAAELFGVGIGPYALLACGLSFLVSGQRGIYAGQK